ncbi:MAG: hypothetical protein JEZ06_01765 [Anaerolineaceae bacterium]|nr:hypothetical protein [Anaerolineaceae bacterium]
MMLKRFGFWILISLAGISLLTACLSNIIPSATEEADDISLALTSAAATVQTFQTDSVFETMVAGMTQIGQPTPIVVFPTETPQSEKDSQASPSPSPTQPTNTPQFTVTPIIKIPTGTNTPKIPTPTTIPCNWIKFVEDVTIEDGSDFSPGDSFVKTWRLKNIGTCTWNTNYDLVFSSGNAMNANASYDLKSSVSPGETIDISLTLKAPDEEGTYISNWKLRSDNGLVFGLGSSANSPFWVEIDVLKPAPSIDPDEALDFVVHYKQATWKSGTGTLSAPGPKEDFTNGTIYKTDNPVIEESYTDDEPTLIMIPSSGTGGLVYGRYPAVNVQAGDHFTAMVGCLTDSDNCNAMLQLNYVADGGAIQNLDSWTETFDGNRTHINVDLSTLAGKSVEFILQVNNNDNSDDDRIFWMVPKIQR